MRFDEATRDLSLYSPAADKFAPSFPAGWPAVLSNGVAKLYLNECSVTAAGPLSPTVTLRLTLGFNPQAAGQAYPIELRATNELGEFQGFALAGTIVITAGGRER